MMEPYTVMIVVLCLLILGAQLLIDYRRSRLISTFRSKQNTADTGLSVIVELTKSPKNLRELFEHLSGFGGLVEVIVIIKRTAGKTARRQLFAMRADYPGIAIRTSAYKRGMDATAISRRLARKPFVAWMQPHMRLEGDFIRLCARHFDNADVSAVSVHTYVPVGRSIASALMAWRTIRRQALRLLTRPELPAMIVYRRAALSAGRPVDARPTWLLRVSGTIKPDMNGLGSLRVTLLSLVLVLGLTALNDPYGILTAATLGGLLFLIQLLWLSATPVYAIRERAALVLMLPFTLADISAVKR